MASDSSTTSTAPQIIHDLIAKFAERRDTYKLGDYNETQPRAGFSRSLLRG